MLDAASFLSVSLDTSKLQSVLEKVSSQQEASAARVEALEKGLESTTARAVAAETAAEAATQRASRAEECVQKLEAQVAALDIKRISAVIQQVGKLSDRVSALEAGSSTFNDRLKTVEDKIQLVDNSLRPFQKDVIERLEVAEASLSGHSNDFDSLWKENAKLLVELQRRAAAEDIEDLRAECGQMRAELDAAMSSMSASPGKPAPSFAQTRRQGAAARSSSISGAAGAPDSLAPDNSATEALEGLSARLGECEAAASLVKRLHADVQRVEASVGEASSLARALLAAQKRFADEVDVAVKQSKSAVDLSEQASATAQSVFKQLKRGGVVDRTADHTAPPSPGNQHTSDKCLTCSQRLPEKAQRPLSSEAVGPVSSSGSFTPGRVLSSSRRPASACDITRRRTKLEDKRREVVDGRLSRSESVPLRR